MKKQVSRLRNPNTLSHGKNIFWMVIVDSSVWIDAFNNRATPETRWLGAALGRNVVGLTSLILCEVLRGFRSDKQFHQVRDYLLALPVFEDVTATLAIDAAQNFRVLRRKGITVSSTIDCVIATFCTVEGHQILHSDHDFDPFQSHLGLQVIIPI